MLNLWEYLSESLRIEGVLRPPLLPEMEATTKFLALPKMSVGAISELALAYSRDADLRIRRGMNVRASDYAPPAGGAAVTKSLQSLIDAAPRVGPFETHIDFMCLLPFMAANGTTGRTIWLWAWLKNGNECPQSFLREWLRGTISIGRAGRGGKK